MCLFPTFRHNPKYRKNQKNGGVIPPIRDNRVLLVPTGCGKCIECRKQKARGWQQRLLEDVRHHKNGKFVTFTFSDQSITKLIKSEKLQGKTGYVLDNEIAKLAVRRFLERWRKKYKKSVRHWLVTELGHNGTENIHLHGILWTDESVQTIREIWGYGFIWCGYNDEPTYVSEQTVNYITKYIMKTDSKNREYKPIILNSKGIGADYLKREDSKRHTYKGEDTIVTYKNRSGVEVALPTYWRNKIWTDEEREQLWIDMLDRDERYVCGEKIENASTIEGQQEYYSLLEHYRNKNYRLGFGDNTKDWDRKRYENERRILKQQERYAKGLSKIEQELLNKINKSNAH